MKSSIPASKAENGPRDGSVFTVLQDIRYGLRFFAKKRSFAIFALITLAVGIGVNTAVFSMVNAVLLRSLPYGRPDQICIIWSAFKAAKVLRAPATGPELVELKTRSRMFQDFAAISVNNASLTGKGEPEQIKLGLVSANFFTVLGIVPAQGRSFLLEEEGPGTARVAILNDGFWRRRYGSDPSIIGQSVEMDGQTYTVVGVMPRDFRLTFPPDANLPTEIQAWSPFPYKLSERPRAVAFLRVIGRLSDHASLGQAQQELDTIATQLRSQFNEFTELDLYIRALPLQADVVKDVKPTLLALFAAVALVLLISCVNVANLLLTLANGRMHEVTVRAAVGAPRSRIIRQLLTESMLLSCIAGALGLGLAWLLVRWLLAVWPGAVPPIRAVTVDFSCLIFTFGISLLTGIVFGLAPAISISKVDLSDALKEMTRIKGTGRQGLRKALVLSEVMLACVLLIGSGLMVRTFIRVGQVDPGFVYDNTLTFKINLPASRYPNDGTRTRFLRQLEQDLRGVPGVQSIALTSHLPFDDFPEWIGSYWPENATMEQQQGALLADQRAISADFFRSFGANLIMGREFTETDDGQHARVAIIDESLAQQLWPNESPIGKKLSTNVMTNGSFARDWSQVVGVVRHIKFHSLMADLRPQIYLPYFQTMPPRLQMVYTLRTGNSPESVIGSVRAAVAKVDNNLPVAGIRRLDQYVEDAKVRTRFITLLSGVLAAVALLLACIGIYGVTSYSVAQRTSEIGMRMALGANPNHVLAWVLRDTLLSVIVGIVFGVGMSFGLAPLLSSMLFQIKPVDPLTFTAVAALLFSVAFLGCFVPAWRASRMNPVVALRAE